MLTAYDYPTAQIVDEAGIDVILVSDSAGMVVQGLTSTIPVTMEEMLYHAKPVLRAAASALVVSNLPFLSYQGNCVREPECRQGFKRSRRRSGEA